MIVKDESFIRKVLDAIVNYKDKYKVLGLLIVFILAVSFAGYQYKKGVAQKNNFGANLKELSKTVEVEKLYLDIKFENYQHLLYERSQILKKAEILGDSIGSPGLFSFSYTPAKLVFNDEKIKVKLKLKGDRLVHFKDENEMSYRIKIGGDNTLLGMKKFSLHKPKHRNYIHEWIYHTFMNREGIASLQYKFINLYINGEDKGIYALEEHFDKRLLERQARREGPIIRFNEGMGGFTNLAVGVFNESKWVTDSLKLLQTSKAVSLLTEFKEEKITMDQVFDIKKLADFFALCDLLGMNHGTLWKSIRFYYNPISSRLEPIAYDGHYGTVTSTNTPFSCEIGLMKNELPFIAAFTDWHKLIFNTELNYNEEFYRYYIESLNKLSKKKYLEDFFAEIQPELTNNLAIINKDAVLLEDNINSYGPGLFKFSLYKFNQRANYIQKSLNHISFSKENKLDINEDERELYILVNAIKKDSITLAIANMKHFPVDIKGFSKKDSLYNTTTASHIIMQKGRYEFPQYKKVTLKKPNNFNPDSFKVAFSVLGLDSVNNEQITDWAMIDKTILENDLTRKKANIKDKKFLEIEEGKNIIRFKNRTISIDKDLIIPKGYTVYCPQGTKINLTNKANILSYSSFMFIGTEENPITIQSPDSSGQGLIVMNTNKDSHFKFVKFKNLTNPNKNDWNLTGAITFYKANVKFENCLFYKNYCEDYLNIVNTESYIIDLSTFLQVKSDAFDSDFSKGYVYNTSFNNIGNDAIDISGSYLDGNNIQIENAGDKGVSGGEASNLDIKNIKIKKSNIGLASKDKTRFVCSNATIDSCNVGVVALQKKSEYGPGKIKVNNMKITNTSKKYLVEENSEIIIDAIIIKEHQKNLKDDLY